MLYPVFHIHLLHCTFYFSSRTQTAAETEEHSKSSYVNLMQLRASCILCFICRPSSDFL